MGCEKIIFPPFFIISAILFIFPQISQILQMIEHENLWEIIFKIKFYPLFSIPQGI